MLDDDSALVALLHYRLRLRCICTRTKVVLDSPKESLVLSIRSSLINGDPPAESTIFVDDLVLGSAEPNLYSRSFQDVFYERFSHCLGYCSARNSFSRWKTDICRRCKFICTGTYEPVDIELALPVQYRYRYCRTPKRKRLDGATMPHRRIVSIPGTQVRYGMHNS